MNCEICKLNVQNLAPPKVTNNIKEPIALCFHCAMTLVRHLAGPDSTDEIDTLTVMLIMRDIRMESANCQEKELLKKYSQELRKVSYKYKS